MRVLQEKKGRPVFGPSFLTISFIAAVPQEHTILSTEGRTNVDCEKEAGLTTGSDH